MASDGAAARVRLTIDGPATIVQAAALRDRLAAAIADASHVDLDFRPTALDLSSIQIVHSAWASLRHNGGQLRLTQSPTGPLLEALSRGGFSRGQQDGPWSCP